MTRLGASAVALLALSLPSGVVADAPAPTTVESYRKARKVLDAAVEAVGGAERINAIETVTIVRKGTTHARNQSSKVTPPYQTLPQGGQTALDLKRGWLLFENDARFPGGFVLHNRTVFRGEEDRFVLNLLTKTVQRNPSLQPSNIGFVHRLFPPLLLRKALQRATTLRWLGEAELKGRAHDVIGFAWDDGGAFSLYVDSETHLLTKYELLFPDALTGDAVAELYFPSYTTLKGLQVPSGYLQVIAGEKASEIEYTDVKIDEPLDAPLSHVPEGFETIDPTPTDPPRVKELAKDVYIVEGLANWGYNALFVAFDDYILAVEAPVSSQVSAQAISLIEEKLPDKPIRYVVLTHHHDDHSGGVRAFITEGATVVTTAANQAFLERMASASYDLGRDALARKPRKPEFELVEGKRVFDDGTHVVEIHNIGPNPHADDLFVVYLPKEKILFEADMLGIPRSGPIAPAREATVHFSGKIAELGLEVETLVGVHGTVGSMADLEKALKKREAQSE